MSDYTTIFCRQVRQRSSENRQAVQRLFGLPGQVVSILRQELDSMVRVIYLLAIPDRKRRLELIESSATGRDWTHPNSKRRITDREMVELAERLQGWTRSVYRFGCAFIHLSACHDYKKRDPIQMLSEDERQAIINHMRCYHGGPNNENPSFQDLVVYLPWVFDKIAGNLECYLKSLEQNQDID